MCGIVGFADPSLESVSNRIIDAMSSAVLYRGPDDSGRWLNLEFGVAFGHRRLSILDLSPLGHQPMHSGSGRFVLTFNGEIYNFRELSSELKQLGHSFRGSSDTEVMLAAFEEWGISASVEKFVGMFACAVWDNKENLIHLIRDRIGKKPLYYGWSAGAFIFGSELKALLIHPKCSSEIDREALAMMLRYGYIASPWSIYRKIFKLSPGTILTIRAENFREQPAEFSQFPDDTGKSFRPSRYWGIREIASAGAANPFEGDEREAALELEKLLLDAVGIRMISDVPLGAFLSGGIDSTAVVAMMQAQSSQPVRTFSIGFQEKEYNEAAHARAVADHLGTNHTELYMSPKDALDVVPLLPQIYDEPFGDSSQIPTFLVSKLCSQHVAVSLSGDGGDELFCGYERYPWAHNTWSCLRWFPNRAKQSLSQVLAAQPSSFYEKWADHLQPFLPERFKFKNPAHKFHTFARMLKFKNRHQFYQGIMSHWDPSDELVIGETQRSHTWHGNKKDRQGFLAEMMTSDMENYLPDDIMVKVDRASMAVSLEARAPLLDHRIIEFSARLPIKLKIEGALTKKVLRRIVHNRVPKSLMERPKMGFAVPIDRWLRHELRDWAENLISEEKLKAQGFLRPEPIQRKWQEHLSGNHRWEHSLWNVLMFQAWLENKENTAIAPEL